MSQQRNLAAILFTDIVGYTSMMQRNEEQAVIVVRRHQSVMEQEVARLNGSTISFYGLILYAMKKVSKNYFQKWI